MPTCPHCEASIERLDGQIPLRGTEYFTEDIPRNRSSRDYNDQNTEWDGDPEYNCPDCGENLSEEEIVEIERQQREFLAAVQSEMQASSQVNQDQNQAQPQTPAETEGEGDRFTRVAQHQRFRDDSDNNGYRAIECPECHHMFNERIEQAGQEVFCPRCSHNWGWTEEN